MTTHIIVRLSIEGIHRWKDCPIGEVDFLRSFHRHNFGIVCEKEVKNLDREIEIISFKREIESYLKSNYYDEDLNICNFGNLSCEMIGEELLKHFDLNVIEVNEDFENGAKIYK